MKETSTSKLLERRERFERTVIPHVNAMFGFALRLTGAWDRAEDALQDAYLRAWKYFDTFTEGRDPKTWLIAVLRNAIFEGARKRRRQPGPSCSEEIDWEGVAGAAFDPAARLKELDVLGALERLPEGYRVVAMLAIVDELSYREIAEVLGVPIGTVMSRLFRARELLREHLGIGVDEPAGENPSNPVRRGRSRQGSRAPHARAEGPSPHRAPVAPARIER